MELLLYVAEGEVDGKMVRTLNTGGAVVGVVVNVEMGMVGVVFGTEVG